MGSITQQIPSFLEKQVTFPNNHTYEIISPLTDLRKCHDGRPLEARIVFTCKQIHPEPADKNEEFVMKVKIQAPITTIDDSEQQTPEEGPSTTTAAELKALEKFTAATSPYTPHLISFKKAVQGPNGMLPGGYLTYIVMTKMPGKDLLVGRFWDLDEAGRDEIRGKFLDALRSIYGMGIEPVDCALRNVLWEAETKRCTIIDFELWREATEIFTDDMKELERWGLVKRKPPRDWWMAWNQAR